jgi:acyl carrier protein
VLLESLPQTPNGKVDRKALPAPQLKRYAGAEEYVAPVTDLERTIEALWKETLGIECISATDNFFDTGGHSLLLVRLSTRLSATLGLKVPVADLFRHPTIASLAQHLAGNDGEGAFSRVFERAARRREALHRRRERGRHS